MSIFYKPAIPARKLPAFTPEEKNPNKNEIHCCISMNTFLNDVRIPIHYSSIYREYDIPLLYKKHITALQGIFYCPWCSKKLPTSLRDKWFDCLSTEYKIDDPFDSEQEKLIPEEFKSDQWWKQRKL